MIEEKKKLDIKKWINRSISFDSLNLDELWKIIVDSIEKNGFKIRKNDKLNETMHIEALFGSRLKAFIVGLIPFGKHFSSGKRLLLKASLEKKTATLKINMTPYMEIFGSEEVGGVTQSFDEKATDEYFAAKKIHTIFCDIHKSLKLQLPEELLEFDIKGFATATLLGILIYPLDSYSAAKTIYIPEKSGPAWCWGGFILPEVWFIWNEIWGVSILAMIPTVLYFKSFDWEFGQIFQYSFLAIVIFTRLFLGFMGNKIFYSKYGRWPNQKKMT